MRIRDFIRRELELPGDVSRSPDREDVVGIRHANGAYALGREGVDTEFFRQLSSQGGARRLAGLDVSTGKAPLPPPCTLSAASWKGGLLRVWRSTQSETLPCARWPLSITLLAPKVSTATGFAI